MYYSTTQLQTRVFYFGNKNQKPKFSQMRKMKKMVAPKSVEKSKDQGYMFYTTTQEIWKGIILTYFAIIAYYNNMNRI